MKRFLIVSLLCGLFSGSPAFATKPESLDLYLLIGQSNMAGRGALSEADRKPDPRIFVLNKENAWVSQGEPIHFDKPGMTGVGLGFTFAKLAAAKNPGVTVGLIPCAVGGTPIARWKPGADLYEAALARAKLAQQSGRLKGILWHQGESESGDETKARAYAENLAEVAAGFRRDLNAPDVPFIAGELGEFLYTRKGDKSPFARVINEQINTLPSLIPHAAAVSSAGLGHKGDELHFSSEALKEFGARYFAALQSLQATSSRSKKP
ncbi:sialate O-acetylesterase [Rariglobus hedericola]|uniref:Sialate O-acetylesterase n=1 Tax=Rariglobus hedericola TaxID=2597822 RepID=A0A556QKF0_9BACT|nr:sialate O-acetylesterase [Rariglobus hedericola]TSJ77108.1 sialate O-acetylesterase [Rariglobus hedericola]